MANSNLLGIVGGNGRLTSRMGYRNTNVRNASNNHKGVDIASNISNAPVYARYNGIIAEVGVGRGFGNYVLVEYKQSDGRVFYALYAHLSKTLNGMVGKPISAGEYVGNIGHTTGGANLTVKDHLHYEERIVISKTSGDPYQEFLQASPVNPEGDYIGNYQQELENANKAPTPNNDILILTDQNNIIDALAGDDYVEGRGGNDLLVGNDGEDVLWGGSGNDNLYGGRDHDILYGDIGSDTLSGGSGSDELYGGSGNDVLLGNDGYGSADTERDEMYGGSGYDTYVTNNGDIVYDSDGSGLVVFEGVHLTGGNKDAGKGCEGDDYKGNGGSYMLIGTTLIFTKDDTFEQLTITGWKNGQLGITLKDNPADNGACPVEGACPKPVTPPRISLALPTQYIGGGSSTGGGGTSGPAPKLVCVYSPELNSTGIGGGGSSTGPIVLDLNRNGITSISLAASITLFDYDGDGVLENTAWIENSDALLVNDVNNDGIINNASELFGNYTHNSDGSISKSGYQALKTFDSNYQIQRKAA